MPPAYSMNGREVMRDLIAIAGPNPQDWAAWLKQNVASLDEPLDPTSPEFTLLDRLPTKPLVPFPDPILSSRINTLLRRLPRLYRSVAEHCIMQGDPLPDRTDPAQAAQLQRNGAEQSLARHWGISRAAINLVKQRLITGYLRRCWDTEPRFRCLYCHRGKAGNPPLRGEEMYSRDKCWICWQQHRHFTQVITHYLDHFLTAICEGTPIHD